MSKSFWLSLTGVLTIVVLLFIVFRSCDPAIIIPDKRPVVEDVKRTDSEMKRLADSLKVLSLKDDTIRQLRLENSLLRKTREKTGDELSRQAAKVIERENEITSVDCDSLAYAAIEFKLAVEREIETKDLEIDVLNRKIIAMEEIIEHQRQLYSDLRCSFDALEQQNDDLQKQLRKEVRKKRGAKTINRILAGAALVVGGIFITL